MAIHSPAPPLSSEEEKIFEFRASIFEEELGFTPNEAAALAVTKDSTGMLYSAYKVKHLLDSGCSRELALRIIL